MSDIDFRKGMIAGLKFSLKNFEDNTTEFHQSVSCVKGALMCLEMLQETNYPNNVLIPRGTEKP